MHGKIRIICRIIPRQTPISAQGPLGPSDDIGRGWYGILCGICHVLYALLYISTEEYYIIWTVFLSIALGYLQFYFCLVSRTTQLLIRSTWVTLQFACCCFENILFTIVLFVCFVFFIVPFSVPKNMKTWRSWRHIPNNDIIQLIASRPNDRSIGPILRKIFLKQKKIKKK